MSLFRKQSQTTAPDERDAQTQTPVSGMTPSLFNGARVDIDAIYRAAKLVAEELDRVVRAEELLHLLPSTASHKREVVDATFRAFGVDRTKIVAAASKQLESLESFIRYSHEQTQRVIDAGAARISELEAEIARCREASAKATGEGEERARAVNEVLVKVQRVLEFFGDESRVSGELDLDADTVLSKPKAEQPRPKPPTQRTTA